MTLEFRKVQRRDLPELVALLAEVDDETPLDLEDAQRILREMSRYRSYVCYVAVQDGRVVGTFSMLVFPTLVHNGAFEALVEGVAVAQTHRGRGIGGAMMREAQRLAAEAGCYKLALSSNTKREDAHRFYDSLGFRRHGLSFYADIVPAAAPFEAMNGGLIPIPD